jgi:hypothetical protein
MKARTDVSSTSGSGPYRPLHGQGHRAIAGRLVSGRFASEQEATLAMTEHLKTKLSKGYEAV